MSEPITTTHTEGWVKFSRYQCKEGFIDRWMGDVADNPNLPNKSTVALNAFSQWFRLNGKGAWVSARDLNPAYMAIINHCCDDTSEGIWHWLNQLHGT